jgi:hypothetical protein
MSSLIRRRLGQVRQVGPRVAIRIVVSRCVRGLSRLCESMFAHLMATGLSTIKEECQPSIIIPRASAVTALDLKPFGGAFFDFLGGGRRHVPQQFRLGDFPRPWRLVVKRHSGTIVHDHCCIDWHVDPTSGFRWSASVRSSAIRYGNQPGIEVKWPWELGRLQHLPAIAARGAVCWRDSEPYCRLRAFQSPWIRSPVAVPNGCRHSHRQSPGCCRSRAGGRGRV